MICGIQKFRGRYFAAVLFYVREYIRKKQKNQFHFLLICETE